MGLLVAIAIAALLLSTLTLLASATWDLLHQLRIRARWAVPLALGLGHLAGQGDLVVLGTLLGAARILDILLTCPAYGEPRRVVAGSPTARLRARRDAAPNLIVLPTKHAVC